MWTRYSGCRRNRGRGTSLVEFALIFGIFLLIIAGLVELGRGVWAYTTIAHAARQGARYVMARGSENPATASEVQNVVRNAAVGLDRNRVQVTTRMPGTVARGSVVEISVRYDFDLVTGSLILPGGAVRLGANTRAILAN